MPALFIFLLKVNAALLLFCAGYYLVLRHLTFYTLNRVYLMGAIIFSTVYPQINLDGFFQRHQQLAQPVYVVVDNLYFSQQVLAQPVYWTWLEVIFFAGVILLAAKLFVQLISLYKVYRASRKAEIHGHEVRVVNGDGGPFSFWKSIYINPTGYTEADLRAILKHEQIHTDEWHTLDILLAELSVIFYWFNPGVWLMRKAVRENIEFITDRKILQQGADTKQYQYSLLNVSFSNTKPGIANHFNISTLKKRILMMNAKRSSNVHISRYLLLVPVLLVLLLAFSGSRAAIVKTSKATYKALTLSVDSIVNDNPVTNAVAEMFTDSVKMPIVAKKGDTIKIIRTGKKDTIKLIGNAISIGSVITRDSIKLEPEFRIMTIMTDSQRSKTFNVQIQALKRFQLKADSMITRIVLRKRDSVFVNGQVVVHDEPVEIRSGRTVPGSNNKVFWRIYPTDSLTSKKIELMNRLESLKISSDGKVTRDDKSVIIFNSKPTVIGGTSDYRVSNAKTDTAGSNHLKELLSRIGGIAVNPDGSVTKNGKPINNIVINGVANPTRSFNLVTAKGYQGYALGGGTNISNVQEKLIMIDGKEATPKELKKLSVGSIQSLRVEKSPDIVKEYGEKAKEGVVFITTKKDK